MVRTESTIARVRAAMKRGNRPTRPTSSTLPLQRITPVVAKTMTRVPRATR